jgi:hypothetical protein
MELKHSLLCSQQLPFDITEATPTMVYKEKYKFSSSIQYIMCNKNIPTWNLFISIYLASIPSFHLQSVSSATSNLSPGVVSLLKGCIGALYFEYH